MERIKPYFPILTWAPRYKPSDYLSRDIIAGLTVALTVVPQGLAYASLAKLPTEYGLYTSYVSGKRLESAFITRSNGKHKFISQEGKYQVL
ncbi:unnamed protein product [Oikopleura dioica]|uniref:SLC26A/SulP transporter domain-containing protein n=1 Tax=Oikopleura dioica TaxID=34765 RepID=E4X6P9_OIKDI|nr:unnamed protein product [Oikopleura dioica]